MPQTFSMRALGKGSLASFMKAVLGIVWVVLWIAAAALALGSAGYLCLMILIGAGIVPMDVLEVGDATINLGPVTIQAENDDRLVLPVVAPALLASAVAVGGALIIVARLRKLFANFTSGEPFSADNASHLRVIWITMLVMELSRYAIAAIIVVLVGVFGTPETTEIEIQAPVNLMTWGAIFVLIVLAEVFREGARLKEEQELTI
ncbi:MAG: DUF2975 domain-containing protein [Hyphomonadaceae bacterium]